MTHKIIKYFLQALVTSALLMIIYMGAHLITGTEQTQGILRLTWRINAEKVEFCIKKTTESLAKIPAHMRRAQSCEIHPFRYQFVVEVNGQKRVEKLIVAPGARGDRPLFVAEDLSLEPGTYSVKISFEPLVPVFSRTLLSEEEELVAKRLAEANKLHFDKAIAIEKSKISIVHYNHGMQSLVEFTP